MQSSRLPIVGQQATHLPTLAGLRALWREVTQKPLWAPPHFWRYVRLRRRMHLRLLDATQVRLVGRQGKVNDCLSCTDICCVGPKSTVLLRLADVATLMDLGRQDLMTHVKPRFDAALLAGRPALRRQVASPGWHIFPVLKQDSMHACAALTREGKCSLHPHWPLACARFPYALHLDDMEAFYSRRCQSYWIHPGAAPQVTPMVEAAVRSYNERIKDLVLLEYARPQLAELGLLQHLAVPQAQ